MAAYTYAQQERATRAMIKAIPAQACEFCHGCGFVQAIDPGTARIIPIPCRATPACDRHADMVLDFLAECVMRYAFAELVNL